MSGTISGSYGGAPAYDPNTGTVYDALTGHPYGGGGVYSLFGSVAGGSSPTSFYTPGGNAGGITAMLGSFSDKAFASLQDTGAGYFSGLNTYVQQSTAFHASFADRIASIFEGISKKSAKAPSGLFGALFG